MSFSPFALSSSSTDSVSGSGLYSSSDVGRLGRTALDDQLSSASHWKEVFAAKRSKCAEETKRLGGMYFKLAVLLGIALIVLVA